MAYERSLVKKLKGLPVQILGVNLDADAKETHERCVKDGISWPSVHLDWKAADYLYANGIPHFLLVDAKGVTRFQGRDFQFECMRELEQLLAEMGHKVDLVEPEDVPTKEELAKKAKAKAELEVLQRAKEIYRTGTGEILGRIIRNESLDQKVLDRLIPADFDAEVKAILQDDLFDFRAVAAANLNHAQALAFIRECVKIKDGERLNQIASGCLEFSKQFEFGDELAEACLGLAERAVKLDSNYLHLATCADWLACFPDRIDEAIEMQENAIEVAGEIAKDEDAMEAKEKKELKVWLEKAELFLEKLKAE